MQYQESVKELSLKLVKSSAQNEKATEFVCESYTMNFNVMSISCQLIRAFDKDEIYTVQISTGTGSYIDVNDFYDDKQNNDENMAYLSVVLMDSVVDYQAGLLYLQVNLPHILSFKQLTLFNFRRDKSEKNSN